MAGPLPTPRLPGAATLQHMSQAQASPSAAHSTAPPPRFEGRVALVTGAAKGQGRSHCVRLAEEGADVIAVDVCADLATTEYDQGTHEQLAETVSMVRSHGQRALAVEVDVRDAPGMRAAVDRGVAELGRLDLVVANAGVIQIKPAMDITDQDWADVLGINLTGAWNTVRAALPALLAQGSGSVVLTSSAAGLKGPPGMAHYAASKTGLVGLMRTLATELGPQGIRVNTVHPTTVDTDMIHWPAAYRAFRPDLEEPRRADVEPVFASLNVMPVPWIEPGDVSDAVLWLLSDDARYVTGAAVPVDAGTALR